MASRKGGSDKRGKRTGRSPDLKPRVGSGPWALRAVMLLASLLVLSAGLLFLIQESPGAGDPSLLQTQRLPAKDGRLLSSPEPTPSSSDLETVPVPSLTGPPAPPAQEPADPIAPYRGLGAWIDRYDYGHADSPKPSLVIQELVRRGVRTLYLGAGSWKVPRDIVNPGAASALIEQAHAAGIQVIGWDVPGFADLNRDLRVARAILRHRTPLGQGFDGFAADIEDLEPTGYDLARFNRGVTEYSKRLRAMVGPEAVLGAIVLDAKNIERAPGQWAGFPWARIGADFDVVLPMAYWSITKPAHCPAYDAAAYIRRVVTKTQALIASSDPIHPIGGLADCLHAREVAGYVNALKETGSIGGSLYDFATTQSNREREAIWAELARINS